MASDGDDWPKRILTLVAFALGLSSAGTLISLSGDGPKAAQAPGAMTEVQAAEALNETTAPMAPGMARILGLVSDMLGPVEPPPAAAHDEAASCVSRSTADPVSDLSNLACRRGIRLHVVIATVPDWVDSSLQWTFDPVVDAIQMAAGQMGYVPNSFDVPDIHAGARGGNNNGSTGTLKTHESEPGVILFRRYNSVPDSNTGDAEQTTDSPPRSEILVVLLVGESAMGGVHAKAMATAIEFATRWYPAGEDGPVRILGPSYSGSAISLRTALDAARQRPGPLATKLPTFDIVTPSASSPENPAHFDEPGVISFRSAVRSDDELLFALARFLGKTDRGWRCGKRVALLVEANTSWGRRFFRQTDDAAAAKAGLPQSATGGPYSETTCYGCMHESPDMPFEPGRMPMPCATILPFPLHISRLRSEAAQAAKPAEAVHVPSAATVNLPLSDPPLAIDRVPSVTPLLTAANVETTLGSVFRAIEERNVTAIGVLATDKRDHLFLAEEIAKRTPNILPFTIESNLIYLHPDVTSYLRGTVVASTYSLSDRTQFLTRPILANHLRYQFTSSAAQGVFNGLLALMGDTRQMLDFDTPAGPGEPIYSRAKDGPCQPGHASCRPPVWISIVARDSLMPITSAPPLKGLETGYVLSVSNPEKQAQQRPQQDYIGEHGLFNALALALLAALAWHWRHVVTQRLEEMLQGERLAALNAERRASRFAREAAVIALVAWLAKLGLISYADGHHLDIDGPRRIMVALCVIAGPVVVLRSLQAFWLRSASTTRWLMGRVAAVSFAALIVVWCLLPDPDAREYVSMALVVVAALATCIDLDWSTRAAVLRDVAHWRRLPVLLGLGAVLCLLCHLAVDFWEPADAVMYAYRTASLASLVSPAPMIAMLCAAVYWWGAWNLRRVQLMRAPEIEVGVGDLLKRRAHRGGTRAAEVFEQPSLTVGLFILLPVLLSAYAFWVGAERVGSVDGRLFGGFLLLGAVCVIAIAGHTLAHTLHLANAILATLRALGRHPSASVFKTIGEENLGWRMTFEEVTVAELEPLARRIERALSCTLGCTAADTARLEAVSPDAVRSWPGNAESVLDSLRTDPDTEESPDRLTERDWRRLHALTRDFTSLLGQTRWRADFEPESVSPAMRLTLEHMEYVVFFHGAVVLRDLLTRLVSGFTTILGALLMLMLGHVLYTFQGREFWLMLDWITIGVTALIGIRVLVSLERDYVLSRLWQTTPGRVSLFGGLSWHLVGYLALTVVSLFAAFFPEVGGGLGKWLEPIRKLIP